MPKLIYIKFTKLFNLLPRDNNTRHATMSRLNHNQYLSQATIMPPPGLKNLL